MAITLKTIKCPECGANLSAEPDRKQMYCSYCGSRIMISNENEHIFRHVDEAELKKAETDRMVKMKEMTIMEQNVSRNNGLQGILTVIWLILSVVILGLCIYKWAIDDDFVNGILMLFYLAGPIVGGGAYLIFKILPEKERDQKKLAGGAVRFPKNLEPFTEKNYEIVRDALINAGFSNVQCLNLHDIKMGLLAKPGRIESICVNGEKILQGGKVYYPETLITITYHGR